MKTNNLSQNIFLKNNYISQLRKIVPFCFLLILSQISYTQSSWLEGSWGITYPVYGGSRMDTEIANNNFDYLNGAQEIVDELPTVGHIITNLSYFANSHFFTISANTNVDVANEIHASIIPNDANDEIIFDVLQKFKDSNKKIILYISCSYFARASVEVHAAWVSYYTNNFDGNEYAAYEDLIEGFIENVKDYADGYWLDTVAWINNDGQLGNFVSMIKATDPTALVTANLGKSYFDLEIDSDGVNDNDPTSYRVVSHEPLNSFQDFTHGHVTPIGQNAPVNSWGYDEFTIPAISTNPWFDYYGKDVIRHAWFPTRERWHLPQEDLVYGLEQAYRFVKQVVDGGAAITWATTTDPGYVTAGHMMADEMAIMKEINNRLSTNPMPNYEPYTRPVCAYLVSEDPPADISVCTTNTGEENVNIALNGTATQSETLSGAEASRAIDGNTDGVFVRESVIAAAGPNAWWQVELDNTYNINEINVFNRTNCCEDRLSDFTVYVLNGTTVTYEQRITEIPTPSVTLNAGGAVGNIVRVESNITATLNIAEVKVYGQVATLRVDTIDAENEKFLVHPNPVSNVITIDFKGSTSAKLEIINYLGKTVMRSNTVEYGSNTFNLSGLSSGLYIVKVSDEKDTYTREIIKK